MSLKRARSFEFSQDTPDMSGAYAIKRKKNVRFAKGRSMVAKRSSVPRAIRSRGTPDGYYEIPVTVYRRVYFNMSTGLWNTDPYTAVTSGSTGYNGFGLGTALDTSQMLLGNGSTSAAISVTVPGFTELQAVFDECKIARIDYEFWVAAQAADLGGTLFQAPNIWVAVDSNGIDPPSNLTTLLQYSTLKCIKGDINNSTKMTVYPKIREDAASDGGEASTATTSAVMRSSTYMSTVKPGALHFGLRGWFETASPSSVTVGYLCIKETQYRRYKVAK